MRDSRKNGFPKFIQLFICRETPRRSGILLFAVPDISDNRHNSVSDSPDEFGRKWKVRKKLKLVWKGDWSPTIRGTGNERNSSPDAPDDTNLSLHLSGTIADCRRNLGRVGKIETLPILQTEIVDIPDRLEWSGTILENRERFYFPDASQISAMVGDHSPQMKTQICIVGDVGDCFESPKLLGSSPPITQVSIFGALSVSGQIHRENQRENCGDYPIYLGRSAKSESPDRLGFSRHMKSRLYGNAMLIMAAGYQQKHSFSSFPTNAWILCLRNS